MTKILVRSWWDLGKNFARGAASRYLKMSSYPLQDPISVCSLACLYSVDPVDSTVGVYRQVIAICWIQWSKTWPSPSPLENILINCNLFYSFLLLSSHCRVSQAIRLLRFCASTGLWYSGSFSIRFLGSLPYLCSNLYILVSLWWWCWLPYSSRSCSAVGKLITHAWPILNLS